MGNAGHLGQPSNDQGPSILGALHQRSGSCQLQALLQGYDPGETITIEAHQLTLSGPLDEARGQLVARVNP